MEDTKMDSPADEPKTEASYKIISFLGSELPEQYHNMVFSKFLRSLRYGNDYFNLIDSTAYYAVYNAYLQVLLTRPQAVVKLAVLTDDSDVVLGWSLIEPNKLHYVHVQKEFRKQGIAKELTKDPFEVITHLTNIGLSIWNNKFPTVKFNPFA